MAGKDIYKVAFDSISAHIAIVDGNGKILQTNRAWQDFAKENDLEGPADCVGMNYLEICETAGQGPENDAADIAVGIRQVLEGKAAEYFTRYPCHSPRQQRWFALRAVRLRSKGKRQVVITHENITPILQAQDALEEKKHELQEQTRKLQESNVALKVLLEYRDKDRQKLEESILVNVKERVLPYLDKLLAANLPARDQTLVEIAEERLLDIVSPFLGRLSSVNKLLTPQEIKVAGFVRDGKTSKEIAEIMALSVAAIDFHRKNLRKKLGLSLSGANLRSFLLGMQ